MFIEAVFSFIRRYDMDNSNNSDEQMQKFVRMGLLGLSAFLLFFIGAHFISNSTAVFLASQDKKLPIYCVKTDEAKVSLSFDAAWGNEDTQDILAVLDKYNVKVTFFMTGGWVDKYPDDVKSIAAAGHDVGNHSQSHKQMSQLSVAECETEITTVSEKIKELTGKEVTLFRPPYGDYNNTLVEAVNKVGCHCVQWDVDTLDTKLPCLVQLGITINIFAWEFRKRGCTQVQKQHLALIRTLQQSARFYLKIVNI